MYKQSQFLDGINKKKDSMVYSKEIAGIFKIYNKY